MLNKLQAFWEKQGCLIHQGYDLEVGAGTFNPATFLRCLGPEPYKAAYIEPSRRPTDGRYGLNPVRTQHYFQYQVMMKPSPLNVQDLCLESLEAIGFNLKEHDIRFVHDDWESPTLGAWGLGWEVWMDGMEVTQFTYFQSCGGQELKPVTGEITYGLERLATYLQKTSNFFDLKYNDTLTYGDIYARNEVEWSHYNFEKSSAEMWFSHFKDYEKEAKRLLQENLPIPAYDFVMKASHAFNMLDARGAISVTERTGYIGRIRDLAKGVAEGYVKSRQEQGFPLTKRFPNIKTEEKAVPPLSAGLKTIDASKKGDFVLEIGSEELPAVFVPIGLHNLEKDLKALLDAHKISYDKIEVYGTPRRLTAYVKGLSYAKAAETTEKKGPQVEMAFSEQGKGFFQANHLPETTLEEVRAGKIPGLMIQKVKDKEHLFVKIEKPAEATAVILQEALPQLILNLDFPKKMRWADLDITYARPLRWIVALFDTEVIPFKVGDVVSDRFSMGHRQLANKKVELKTTFDYLSELKKHFVIADQNEREKSILQQIDKLEKEHQAKILAKEKVIPQVLHLTEWPELTASTFDPSFLKAPKEVLISEMVEHQKYFPVAHNDGSLKNLFIITANNTPSDAIRQGNQKVLSARLTDGVFLYGQDLKIPLDQFNDKLKTVTFQKELGTVYDKVQRIEKLALELQKALNLSSSDKVSQAARYSKADLASHMVYEFPELQGVMGRIYAEKAGLNHEVATAIDEHWMPRGQQDGENAPLPETPTGLIVSLAEKFDNLLGCFSVGLKPSSSSDPYGLRRQVLGIIRMVINNKLNLPLLDFLKAHLALYPKATPETLKEIEAFITQRLKTVFLDYQFQKDEIEASLSSGFSDIYDTYLRIEALHRFRTTRKEFALLNEVFKRAKGQLESQKVNGFDASLLKENAEKALSQNLDQLSPRFQAALQQKNYDQAYELIAHLQAPLNTLFDEVKILDDNQQLRMNRLALLNKVFDLFGQLIDFSKIQNVR